MASRDHLAVAAIDFGTTFSGWAFSFLHDHKKDPTQVFARNWNSGYNISPKTPTALLIRPDGKTLEAFGYDAENKYIFLAEEDKHKDYYFFYRFKMMLFKQKTISRIMKLKTEDGKELPAIIVFKLAIAFLKDDLLKECGTKLFGGITVSDIHWTLTVPTIWNEKAKKFMREAAILAGIEGHKLTIVLEPESASMFCSCLPLERSYDGHIRSLGTGSEYSLIDCGGGTTDICCHRIMADGTLQEIYRADGEAVGGTDVDKAFEVFLEKIFGHSVWNEFKSNNRGDALALFRSFEVKKREMKSQGGDPITFSLPAELVRILQESENKSIQERVTSAGFQNDIKVLRGNKIKVNADCLRENVYYEVVKLFRSVLVKHFGNWKLKDIQAVLLVGGFSESTIIQNLVRQTIAVEKIITIQEPSMAVVKGAVIYGHDESVLQVRIARYTYGYRTAEDFDANSHDETKSWVGEDGIKRVSLFNSIVQVFEELPTNDDSFVTTLIPLYNDQSSITVEIFVLIDGIDLPTYTDDPRCIELGKITTRITNITASLCDRKFLLKLKFGGTEMRASFIEQLTGRVAEANIDFLG